MATNNLEVKFKVETSDLRKGSSDAKRTVKDTADQMARDVNGAAQNMSSSMGKVNDATKQIANAANTASNGVRSLEQNVAQSAANMERSLSRVSRQMSAMQMFHLGARAATMIGGMASNIAKLNGNYEVAEEIDTLTSVANGAFQGVAMGTPLGPWGQVIGGLMGAGSALLEAAVKQKEAAVAQIKEAKERVREIDSGVKVRQIRRDAEEMANLPLGEFNERLAQDRIDKAKRILKEAEERQDVIQDMMFGRNNTETTITDWGQLLYGDPNVKYKKLPDGSVLDLERDLPHSLGVVNWIDTDAENYIKKLISDAVDRRSVYPTLANTIGTLGGPEEYGELEGDRSFYYAGNKLIRILSLGTLGFSRDELFDKITTHVFNTLAAASEAAAKEVAEAQEALDALAPLQQRLDKEAADSARRMAEPLNFEEAEYYGADVTQEPRYWANNDKEALAAGAQKLKDLTSLLNGVVKGTGFSSPTDALTRIGGGRGYASYNDSAARVQKNIEANLKTLIKNQTEQNADILHAIENIGLNENAIEWQEDN